MSSIRVPALDGLCETPGPEASIPARIHGRTYAGAQAFFGGGHTIHEVLYAAFGNYALVCERM
jgi:hypothetical protein